MNAESQSRGSVAAINFVLAHFENDLRHFTELSDERAHSTRPIVKTRKPRLFTGRGFLLKLFSVTSSLRPQARLRPARRRWNRPIRGSLLRLHRPGGAAISRCGCTHRGGLLKPARF